MLLVVWFFSYNLYKICSFYIRLIPVYYAEIWSKFGYADDRRILYVGEDNPSCLFVSQLIDENCADNVFISMAAVYRRQWRSDRLKSVLVGTFFALIILHSLNIERVKAFHAVCRPEAVDQIYFATNEGNKKPQWKFTLTDDFRSKFTRFVFSKKF